MPDDAEKLGSDIFPCAWVSDGNYLKQLYEGTFKPEECEGNFESHVLRSVEEWMVGYLENFDISNIDITNLETTLETCDNLGLDYDIPDLSKINPIALGRLAENEYSNINHRLIIKYALESLNDIFPDDRVQIYGVGAEFFVSASGMRHYGENIKVSVDQLGSQYSQFPNKIVEISRRKLHELGKKILTDLSEHRDRVAGIMNGDGEGI